MTNQQLFGQIQHLQEELYKANCKIYEMYKNDHVRYMCIDFNIELNYMFAYYKYHNFRTTGIIPKENIEHMRDKIKTIESVDYIPDEVQDRLTEIKENIKQHSSITIIGDNIQT